MKIRFYSLCFGVLMALCTGGGAAAAEGADKDTLNFLAGTYRVIGQMPESGELYSGTMTFRAHQGSFEVTRSIGGKTVHGTAQVRAATADKIPLLTAHFDFDKTHYEATYLWRGDLDNYARISGYVYPEKASVKSPGLEALFSVPPTPAK